ncbi:hypothetical protein F7Q99_22680 [Streptomyces kaniharaensis]|uniref:Uncharacterized protein n=1 Tax=Streptomyces kaniharaensis TaxID=212423 RepID=A0A6N7KTZ4_9ACTN|nr:hypothetical protein [Streptomyces kaniharaensis]MQS14990.1 hypothetical protein [Streptomyces kaniharaensis]
MAFHHKYVQALPTVEIDGRQLKPYHITRAADRPLAAELVAAAYETAAKMLPERDDTPPGGWLVLHEGQGALYLCVYAWVWDNVVHARVAAAGEPFLGCPDDDLKHWTINSTPYVGCVWELPTMEHERRAWVRHMLAPDTPDLSGYLADRLPDGPIGD